MYNQNVDRHELFMARLSPAVEDDNISFRKMAAHVLAMAISDLSSKDKRTRQDARRFLFANDKPASAVRHFWLAWMNHNDESFYALLRKRSFQGLPNKLGNIQLLADNAAQSYFNSLPPLTLEDTDHLFLKEEIQPIAAAA